MISAVAARFTKLEDKEENSYRLWIELGTFDKVQQEFKRRGWVNSLGKPPTTASICRWAWFWILEHPDSVLDELRESGVNWSDEDWIEILIKKAKDFYLHTSRGRFYDWIERMGYEGYSEFYSEIAPPNP